MVYVSIETEAGKAVALGRLFERLGCEIVDCRTDGLRVVPTPKTSVRLSLVP